MQILNINQDQGNIMVLLSPVNNDPVFTKSLSTGYKKRAVWNY